MNFTFAPVPPRKSPVNHGILVAKSCRMGYNGILLEFTFREEVFAMAEITESKNFIHAFIDEDIAEGGRYEGRTVHTRFPPEPNGYLHIGHCKALIIDFGTAEKYNGMCNLRMDDTNPTKEDVEFVEAIKEDIHWLGFDWGDRFFYGSDYFEKDYEGHLRPNNQHGRSATPCISR